MSHALLDVKGSYRLIHNGVVGFVTTKDVIAVSGPDALSYLEGQCSQQLGALGDQESTETLILSPQGKIDAYAVVSRSSGELFYVIVDEGLGEPTFERLRRFKLRVRAELAWHSWKALQLRGPEAIAPEHSTDMLVVAMDWPGCVGFDLLCSDAVSAPAGVALGDPDALEVARIEAGIPKAGIELGDKTIPHEAGIVERTVSFTKGCFTGQELVARLDARRAHVPRRLRGAVFVVRNGPAESPLPFVGAMITVGEREVGQLTSVAYSPRTDSLIGLCYVRREVAPPAIAQVQVAGQSYEVSIEELPLVVTSGAGAVV